MPSVQDIWVNDGNTAQVYAWTVAGTFTTFLPLTSNIGNGIALDGNGIVWADNGNNQLNQFDATGLIGTIAWPYFAAWACTDQFGNTWWAVGPDGFSRVTPSGVITNIPLPDVTFSVCLGADGNIWGAGGSYYSITPSLVVTQYPIPYPGTIYSNMCLGGDGRLWAGIDNFGIVRVSYSGVQTVIYPSIPAVCVWAGPLSSLWATDGGPNLYQLAYV